MEQTFPSNFCSLLLFTAHTVGSRQLYSLAPEGASRVPGPCHLHQFLSRLPSLLSVHTPKSYLSKTNPGSSFSIRLSAITILLYWRSLVFNIELIDYYHILPSFFWFFFPIFVNFLNPLQYFCLESSMNRGTWQAIVHGVAKSDTTKLSLLRVSTG